MITVIEGCEEYCTFCVVPYTRGREVSRPLPTIVTEARRLAESGTLEVELLGQTINAYRCPETGQSFADLLEQVAAVEGLERVRYVTSHPRHFGDDLIAVLSRNTKVSRYLHLPVQSGSDRILKAMHRRYTGSEYLDLISRLRQTVPDINLSTDVIVGFPGESDRDLPRPSTCSKGSDSVKSSLLPSRHGPRRRRATMPIRFPKKPRRNACTSSSP